MKKQYIVGTKNIELCINKEQESNIDIMISFMNDMYWAGKYQQLNETNEHNHRIGIYSIHTYVKIYKAYNLHLLHDSESFNDSFNLFYFEEGVK
jgi:hypothetical protein